MGRIWLISMLDREWLRVGSSSLPSFLSVVGVSEVRLQSVALQRLTGRMHSAGTHARLHVQYTPSSHPHCQPYRTFPPPGTSSIRMPNDHAASMRANSEYSGLTLSDGRRCDACVESSKDPFSLRSSDVGAKVVERARGIINKHEVSTSGGLGRDSSSHNWSQRACCSSVCARWCCTSYDAADDGITTMLLISVERAILLRVERERRSADIRLNCM